MEKTLQIIFLLLSTIMLSCAKKTDPGLDIITALTPTADSFNYYTTSPIEVGLKEGNLQFVNFDSIDLGSIPLGYVIKKDITLVNNNIYPISNIINEVTKNNPLLYVATDCGAILLVDSKCNLSLYFDTTFLNKNSDYTDLDFKIFNNRIPISANILGSNFFVQKALVKYPMNLDFGNLDNSTYAEKSLTLINNTDNNITIAVDLNDKSYSFVYSSSGLLVAGCDGKVLYPKQACELKIGWNGEIADSKGLTGNQTHYISINGVNYSLSANIIKRLKTFDNNIKIDILNRSNLDISSNDTSLKVQISNNSSQTINNVQLSAIDLDQYSSIFGQLNLLTAIAPLFAFDSDHSNSIIQNTLGSQTVDSHTDCSVLAPNTSCIIDTSVEIFNNKLNASLKLYATYEYTNKFDIAISNNSQFQLLNINNTNILTISSNNMYKFDSLISNHYIVCPAVQDSSTGSSYQSTFINSIDPLNFECLPDISTAKIKNGHCQIVSTAGLDNQFSINGYSTYKACNFFATTCDSGFHMNTQAVINAYYLSPDLACIPN